MSFISYFRLPFVDLIFGIESALERINDWLSGELYLDLHNDHSNPAAREKFQQLLNGILKFTDLNKV